MTKYVKKSKKLMTLVITAVFKLFKIWLQYFTSWFCSNSCFFFSLSRMMCALRAFQVARGIFGLSITMVGIFSTISFILEQFKLQNSNFVKFSSFLFNQGKQRLLESYLRLRLFAHLQYDIYQESKHTNQESKTINQIALCINQYFQNI